MSILMLFLDGVGIGVDDSTANPFFCSRLTALRSLLNGELPSLDKQFIQNEKATCLSLDATLGIEGLPQSGTGQTALFTGVNAPQRIGKHFGPYPYSTLRPIIEEQNLFRRLKQAGRSVCFANAYPQKFFDYFEHKQNHLTVTTLSCKYNNMPLHRADTLEQGRAISADITNAGWARMGYPHIPVIDAAEAGRRLVRLLDENDFVLFEYWRTDKAGHSENMNDAIAALETFDEMLAGILETLSIGNSLLFMTSDHGNIEDMTTKVHTRNPVPALLYGHRHAEFAEVLRAQPDLTSVTPTIVQFMGEAAAVTTT
jgi:hypothetical protein